MNILHFTPACFPETLGTARRLTELLREDGNRHYFLVPAAPGMPAGEWKEYDNFVARRCRCFSRLGPEIPVISRYLKASVNCRMLLRFPPPAAPEIVHAHSPLEFVLAGRRFARREGIPLVYEIHTLYVDEVAYRKRTGVPKGLNRRAKDLARLWERLVAREAQAVIVQTEALGKRVEKLFDLPPSRIRVIPNGIDGSVFDPLPLAGQRRKTRRERGWEGKTVILYGGYLDHLNGVDFLLHAIADLPKGVKRGVKLVVAGDGPLAGLARERAGENPDLIEFLGRTKTREMPSLYSDCDVFVVPRPDTEAGQSLVPIKLLEAMAMGKLVLASDLESLSEALGGGEAGVIFRRQNQVDFRLKLESIIAGGEEYSGLGEKARKRVLALYSWEASRDLLRELYLEIIKGD